MSLIYEVLNYAQKNKYSRLQSVFTYIDKEQPLHLDFGKHTFGGPFTEGEVEDVKAVFHLTSHTIAGGCSWSSNHVLFLCFVCLFVCFLYFFVSVFDFAQFKPLWKHLIMFLKWKWPVILCLLVPIPVRRIYVDPIFNKYFPSMLKMIGAKFCIMFSNHNGQIVCWFSWTFLQQCILLNFDDKTATGIYYPIPLYWEVMGVCEWSWFGNDIVLLVWICDGSDTKQNERNNDRTGSNFFQHWWLVV